MGPQVFLYNLLGPSYQALLSWWDHCIADSKMGQRKGLDFSCHKTPVEVAWDFHIGLNLTELSAGVHMDRSSFESHF
jgi:hypothetical protein